MHTIMQPVDDEDFDLNEVRAAFDIAKRTNRPAAVEVDKTKFVVITAAMHEALVELIEDERLSEIAQERWATLDSNKLIPAEKFFKELGVKQSDLDAVGDVEIE